MNANVLQGFPDGWTEYGADGRKMSDSARYKALGNAVTVNFPRIDWGEIEMRDSFVFYRSFYEALKEMDKNVQADCLMALAQYALDGDMPGLTPEVRMFMTLAKPQIDANNQKFVNGSKGGRPKRINNQTETKTEPENNQEITEPKPNDNQTETKTEPKETKRKPGLNKKKKTRIPP